jgi:hypothetical protein
LQGGTQAEKQISVGSERGGCIEAGGRRHEQAGSSKTVRDGSRRAETRRQTEVVRPAKMIGLDSQGGECTQLSRGRRAGEKRLQRGAGG